MQGSGRWACFYGRAIPEEIYGSLDLAVLDPDQFELNIPPAPPRAGRPVRLGYLSVGEAEEFRSFWPEAKGRPFVLDPNPDWPESRYIDIRSAEWRKLLLDRVVPGIFAKGYDGLFLDTLDSAEFLEWKDPVRFKGSLDAAESFIKALRKRHPQKLIVTNNALPLLPRLAGAIDGALVEDLYTHYDFKTKSYGPMDKAEMERKESVLKAFREKTGLPVFVILYALPAQKEMTARALEQCRKAGFYPYVATVDLSLLGQITPSPSRGEGRGEGASGR